ELFFTTAEEVGMEGAAKFDCSHIRSKRFLNLDSEEEGIVYVGCAGGGRVTGKFPVTFEDAPKNGTKLKIELSGFLGGHSGVDIGLGRANAAKVLPLVLSDLQDLDFKIRLIDFSGGAKMNAIPREATAIIMIPTDDLAWFSKAIDDVSGKIFSAYPSEEPNLSYSEIALEGTEKVFDEESQKAFFALMFGLPHGVSSMEFEDETMVQTSNNIGIVKMDGYEIEITSMYRSSRESEIDRIAKVIEDVFHNAGAKVEAGNRYSPWEPQFDTVLLNLVKSKFEELFGYKPKVKTIHAGLECAEFYKRIPGVEITSFGPTMGDVHTPNEWLDIESVGRFWVLLQSLLLAE
ncbi:MAG: M20/M25/M40 family metallo-hydrolase, partial [bacterium]